MVGLNIVFALNSAQVTKESFGYLDAIAQLMRKQTDLRLLVEGHTDASGDYMNNMVLSESRATNVVSLLIVKYGIERERLQAKGFGPSRLLHTQQPFAPSNRRVQFRVLE